MIDSQPEQDRVTRRELLLSFVISLALVFFGGGLGVWVMSDPDLELRLWVTRTAVEVRDRYPDTLNWDRMFDQGMAAMIGELDRYSDYLPPSRFDQMREEWGGTYGGIGVSIMRRDDGLEIVSVRRNGPAAEAGLLLGDVILAADSQLLVDLSGLQAIELLRGESGSEVMLTISRPSLNDTLEIGVTRQKIDLLHIPYSGLTADSLLYVRIDDFGSGVADDLEASLDSLLTTTPDAIRGVIIDVRGNPGGLLGEAFATAELLLPEGAFIVGTDGRSRWNEEEYRARSRDHADGLPVAVLIDNASASAAEIFAGALQANDRALLIGDTTFGKGLVQGFTPLTDGSALRLTISRYYLADGRYLNAFNSELSDTGTGIAPDIVVRDPSIDAFPRRLEATGLLREFASLHEEELTATSGVGAPLPREWLDRFRTFALERDFVYTSETTRAARTLLDIAQLEAGLPEAIPIAASLLADAAARDDAVWETHAGHITMRLAELAWQRRFGEFETYRDVLVPSDPVIAIASETILSAER